MPFVTLLIRQAWTVGVNPLGGLADWGDIISRINKVVKSKKISDLAVFNC